MERCNFAEIFSRKKTHLGLKLTRQRASADELLKTWRPSNFRPQIYCINTIHSMFKGLPKQVYFWSEINRFERQEAFEFGWTSVKKKAWA